MPTTTATKLSPKYDTNSFGGNPSFEERVEIFRDQVEGWQLDVARHLLKTHADSGYAALSALVSYFEMIEQHLTGSTSERGSKMYFRNGFRKVYPASTMTDAELDKVYGHVRNGMYHDGFTKVDTLLGEKFPEAVEIDGDCVKVNPHRLEADIRAHFKAYVSALKDPTNAETRTKFACFRNLAYGT